LFSSCCVAAEHYPHSCSEDVNYDAFGRDLQSFFTELESLNSSLVLTADPSAGMSSVAASLEVDQAQINRLLLDLVAIGERHGIRFPRKWKVCDMIHQSCFFTTTEDVHTPSRMYKYARVFPTCASLRLMAPCAAWCLSCAGEFGLFVKQLLYFDRYTRILAPQLKVFDDARVNWKADDFDGPDVTIIPPGSGSGGYAYS
jgi:hypothetical protein